MDLFSKEVKEYKMIDDIAVLEKQRNKSFGNSGQVIVGELVIVHTLGL